MSYFFFAIQILLLALTGFVAFITIYYTFLSFFGFKTAEKDYPLIEDKARFLILIAAHNEENVISSTIENLRSINYDSNLFDIVVINDNSTDSTGLICDQIGVKHVDTNMNAFPREGVGKPGGIQYGLRALGFEELIDKYDLLMILDADNHVDVNILKEINSQYYSKDKPEAIQTYLDSKNSDNLLSLGYATSYSYSNRFFQLAKYRIGLPNALGGTGFAVRIDYIINKGGFCFKSLTEDLELSIEIVKDGGRILWNHFARIYDEKPEKLRMSLKQRTRWSQGHWFVAFTNSSKLLQSFIKGNFKMRYFDQVIYLFSMAKIIQLLICVFAIGVSLLDAVLFQDLIYLNNYKNILISSVIGVSLISIVNFIYYTFILIPYCIYMDSKQDKLLFKRFLAMYYYSLTYFISQFMGLIKWKQQHIWVKTEHTHTSVLGIKKEEIPANDLASLKH